MKVGIQYHKVLDLKKLFCSCVYQRDTELVGPPVLSSFGSTTYEFWNCSKYCRFQMEQAPPVLNHRIVKKAISCASGIPKLKFLPEIVFSRKTILDGSLISGYQRSACIAHSGQITLSTQKVIKVDKVYLEEDSCSKLYNQYVVSRMGLPLLEVVTEACELNALQVKELLKKLDDCLNWGHNTPNLNFCKRQDVNVSHQKRSRVQYKGVDKLSSIQRILTLEAKTEDEPETFEEKGTVTYYYDAQKNVRVPLRTTLKSERMTRETQVDPLRIEPSKEELKAHRKLKSKLAQLLKNKELESAIMGNLVHNMNQLKTLLKLHKTCVLNDFDLSAFIRLAAIYKKTELWKVFKAYLKDQLSYEGLKQKKYVVPYQLSKCVTLKQTTKPEEFYKKYKLYLPRKFFKES